jgi:hypothetical protein
MKVDVEGAEELVIAGGRQFLSSHAPVISMEIWGGEGFRLGRPAIEALTALGYRLHALGHDGRLTEPLSVDGLQASMAGVPWDNIVFLKPR